MKSLGRRLKAVESRVRTGETPEIEVWTESVDRPGVYQNRKTGVELTREGLDQHNAERRQRYGAGQVLAIVVNRGQGA